MDQAFYHKDYVKQLKIEIQPWLEDQLHFWKHISVNLGDHQWIFFFFQTSS